MLMRRCLSIKNVDHGCKSTSELCNGGAIGCSGLVHETRAWRFDGSATRREKSWYNGRTIRWFEELRSERRIDRLPGYMVRHE